MAHWNNVQPANHPFRNASVGWALPLARRHIRANPTHVEDAQNVINSRRAAREEQLEHSTRESVQDPSARSRSDLRHQINRSRGRAHSKVLMIRKKFHLSTRPAM